MIAQHTLSQSVEVTGVGLHSGRRTRLCLKPAPINTGMVFIRSDLPAPNQIRVSADAVKNTRMATVLQDGAVSISTIEHLMSACLGLGIDNLYIEVDAPEIPIMDGSSAAFVYLLQSAKIVPQAAPKKFLHVTKTIRIEDGDKWVKISPYAGFKLDFTIAFDHPALKKTPTHASFDYGQENYANMVSKARTFGFTKEVEMLRQAGLGQGGHLDNVIVLDDYRILNEDLRYADEFVRHKILDAMGDLYVIGMPILGHYEAFKAGHALNNQLIRAVLAQHAYDVVTFDHIDQAPAAVQKWQADLRLA